MTENLSFPADFLWGTATAAYQIEGAVDDDGRGASIWDTFAHTPHKIKDDVTGDVACDHYRRWRDDIALMKALNMRAYRLSIAWSRIFPEGRGQINQRGIDFYSQLIDGLLAAGITPFVTLYHWDLPQLLQDKGGWLRRSISDDFAIYTDAVARALGDRVKHWITLNEPWVFSWFGYGRGIHAPGLTDTTPAQPLLASHHTLLAHGAAVSTLRAAVPDAQVGISNVYIHVTPGTGKATDMVAASRFDGYVNRWYFDPIFRGHYPQDKVEEWADYMPDIDAGDMQQIAAPLDFLGINYYTRMVIADDPEHPGVATVIVPQPGEPTAMGWEVYPQGLYEGLKWLHREYAPRALYITENGAAYDDVLTPDGSIHDAQRTAYLEAHFAAASHALRDGVPLKGYFVWSLMDNFEWAEGYSKRFGLYYVDYTTQRRILKDSGAWFAKVASAKG
jgi:beta-glucosidase